MNIGHCPLHAVSPCVLAQMHTESFCLCSQSITKVKSFAWVAWRTYQFMLADEVCAVYM